MIIGIDPGYTSGLCVLTNIQGLDMYDVLICTEIKWSQRLDFIGTICRAHRAAIKAIVIERFVLYDNEESIKAQIGSEMPAPRVIGAIEGIASCNSLFDRIVFQEPRDRRSVRVLDRHIRQLEQSRHNLDAYRHARYWLKQNYRKVYV